MFSITKQKIKDFYKKPLLVVMALLPIIILSNISWAQNDFRDLVLSPNYNEHYLSPYLKKYSSEEQINNVTDIINNPSLQTQIINTSGSTILLPLNDKATWLTLDVINRSEQDNWKVNFGTSSEGRFGFFKNVTAYTFNSDGKELKQYSIDDDQNIRLTLPKGEHSQIILKFEKSKSLPSTVSLRLLNVSKSKVQTFDNLFLLSILFLVGMAFFFTAVTLVKANKGYLLFSIYYLGLGYLLYLQNDYVELNWLFYNNEFHSYIIYGIASISLIIGNFFWYPGERGFWYKSTFTIPFAIGLISIIAGHFIQDQNHLINFALQVGPSILIILLIPLICIMQGESKNENSTPFMLGWFIFLFGICITILALSGIIQPVSTAINAYWFALIPQAIFFIISTKMDVIGADQENVTLSKTLEITESDSISKLRTRKENSEQERLLKVIDQERKVLGELRKSEARRAAEMEKAKELADEANKGKSAFLAVVSHEIRTPMTGIMGMVRMLLNSNLTKEQNEYAQTIQDSSDAMLALLNDILDYEKIEQGKMTFENISFDLHRLIQGVATLMRGHAVQKNIELKVIIGDNLPSYVMGDPTRLRQVLLNLTGNAVKFTEQGGVKITAEVMKLNKESNAAEVYFSVTDNGIGISEEAKKDLFTPFSQADKTISRKFGGTGLGLAISKGLVSGMGSEINISSTEGEGSTFFFTMGMKLGNKQSVIAPSTKSETKTQEIKNIILIDDNHINRKVVRGLLSELPYKIDEDETAEGGLKKIENGNYDLILMDIELPDMNGDEATKKIRSSSKDKIKNIPIIALTGNTQDEHIDHYYQCGINSFISKPIDPVNLIKTIENAAQGIFDSTTRRKKLSGIKKPNNYVSDANTQDLISLEIDNNSEIKIVKSTNEDKDDEVIIKPIIEKNEKQITSFLSANKNNVNKPKLSASDANNPILDMDTLNSLKKHLPKDKVDEMIRDVLVKTEELIENLQLAAKQGKTKEIISNCHDLKGMAGNFGLKEITNIAKDIEIKVKIQPTIIIMSLVNTLPPAKKRAQEALFGWLSTKNIDL